MNRRHSSAFGLLVFGLLVAGPFAAESGTGTSPQSGEAMGARPPAEVSWTVTRLSDGVRMYSGGPLNANITAIRTSNGLILIDSGESVEIATALRALLARDFPGARVTHVVNTHAHWDHILGNAAFPDATIIAQENSLKALVRITEPVGPGETQEKRPADAGGPPPPAGVPPPPPRTPLEVHLTAEAYERTRPDVTFAERHVLRDGGVTVELVYYGTAHTQSDILALVPSERLLFVGDLYFRKTLPSIGQGPMPDVARWRLALDQVSGDVDRFDRVVSGHGEVIPVAEFKAQARYLFEVWDRAGQAVRDGRSLESLQDDLRMDRAFPALSALDVRSSTGGSLHEGNVRNAFRHQGGSAGWNSSRCWPVVGSQ